MTNKLPKPNNSTSRWVYVSCCLLPLVLIGLHQVMGQENPPAETPSKPLQAAKPETVDPAAAEMAGQALETLREARTRLESYDSLKADLLETVLIGARRFQAKGRYLQARGNKVSQEFQLTLDGADGKPLKGSLLEKSDGSFMFSSHRIGDQQQISRRDVASIFAAIEKYPSVDAELLRAKLGIGGLPAMLASLERSFRFTEYKVDTIEGSQYIMIGGGWNESFLKRLRPQDADPEAPLRPYIPDHVRVYFDEQSLFPRRIFYFKKVDNKLLPMLTLDFLNVQQNVPTVKGDFEYYVPEGIVPTDITQNMIDMIIRSFQAQEKLEAAQPESPEPGTPPQKSSPDNASPEKAPPTPQKSGT